MKICLSKISVRVIILLITSFIILPASARSSEILVSRPFYEIYYSPSGKPGDLVFGAAYRFWIPEGIKTLNGLIVHQHGCGAPAASDGATAADDLHWQALARKWNCALLAPSFTDVEGSDYTLDDNCGEWMDPRLGSEKTFFMAINDVARISGHPELEKVPWMLWGHSGGAVWSGNMMLLHPDRVVCVWLRSGYPRINIELSAAIKIPVMLNCGIKEKDDRFSGLFKSSTDFLQEFRKKGGLIGFAPDPLTSHECGNSRYLAIPFFDICISQRLSLKNKYSLPLRPMPGGVTRPMPLLTDAGVDCWLPNDFFAGLWEEYIKTGAINDKTPPPAPYNFRINKKGVLTWESEADFEGGLAGFIIERDGNQLAKLPEKPAGYGRPIFQKMTYHDTPSRPFATMSYRDTIPDAVSHIYEIMSVNTSGLKSEKTKALKW